MARQTSLVTNRVSPPVQVWARLATEQRTQIIRLMAQLAFKLVLAEPNSPLKEVDGAIVCGHIQNSG
jgi:hypothetical protein